MKSVTSFILFFVISARVFSAEFSGVVMDKQTMEPIPYASINVVDLNFVIECDSVGTFHMNANVPSSFSIITSAIGLSLIHISEPTRPY